MVVGALGKVPRFVHVTPSGEVAAVAVAMIAQNTVPFHAIHLTGLVPMPGIVPLYDQFAPSEDVATFPVLPTAQNTEPFQEIALTVGVVPHPVVLNCG